jgi:hypothetical protein
LEPAHNQPPATMELINLARNCSTNGKQMGTPASAVILTIC